MKPELSQQLDLLPDQPGVYLMKDAEGRVLYIGKAKSLKHRVRSYFQAARNLTARVLSMVGQVEQIETIQTRNEVEALILESNLIKQHRPRYNVRLRDDKHYPYLRLTLGDAWPRLVIARQMKRGPDRYFGPYTTSTALYETLRLARRLFPLRTCRRVEGHERVCLQYHIGRCLGPCQPGLTTPEAYGQVTRDLVDFLEGKHGPLLERLRQEMEQAAEDLEFERAAELRNRIRAIEQVTEKQTIISDRQDELDAIAWARGADEACVQVFFVRGGKLIGREEFFLSGTDGLGGGEILSAFVSQHYGEEGAFIPRQLFVSDDLPDAHVLASWLADRRGGPVTIRRPQRGSRRDLLELAAQNARESLEQRRLLRQEATSAEDALEELAVYLGLDSPPYRIECYDISNVQGAETVGSMVVFESGKPAPSEYRRFKIRGVEGPNDFAAHQEMLDRRLKRWRQERDRRGPRPAAPERGFARLPDLIIVDGGKGQLSADHRVLEEHGLANIPIFGLAKENEWLFRMGDPEPIILPRQSPALYLLQRLRDEAHRWAITYHRSLHRREQLLSALDEIPGVGQARRKALLRHFGSLAAIRRASAEEIAQVPGISRSLAERIAAALTPE